MMTTTVRELIEKLVREDPDAIVVTVGQHGLSPFEGIGRGFYAAQNTWSGEWVSDTDPDADDSYAKTRGVKAVCLEPVN